MIRAFVGIVVLGAWRNLLDVTCAKESADSSSSNRKGKSRKSSRRRKSKAAPCDQLILSSHAPHAKEDPRFGVYERLTEGTVGHSDTPVYSSANGAGFFLYRTDSKWMVGTKLHSQTEAGLFVVDAALRPEKTSEVWFAMFSTGWSADPTFKISCATEQEKNEALVSVNDGDELCRETEALPEAEACLRRAIEKPMLPGARLALDLRLANVLYRLNDPGDPKKNKKRMEEASALYRKGISLMPEFADVRQQYGSLLALSNRLSESEDTLREALKLNPLYSSATEDLVRVLQWQDRGAEAQVIKQKAVDLGIFPAVDFRPGTYNKDLPVEPIWTSTPFSAPSKIPRYMSYPCLDNFVSALRDNAGSIKKEFLEWRSDSPREFHLDKFGYADPTIRGGEWQEWYIWPSDPFLNDFHSASERKDVSSNKNGSDCNSRTPITCEVLRKLGVKDWDSSGRATMYEAMVNPGSINVMNARFSVVGPKGHLRPHVGPSNYKLAMHLPIVVPADESGGHGSHVRVKDQIEPFIEGEPMIFDDTFEHEVWNHANESRVTLWIFFSKPELTACGGAQAQDRTEF